MAQRLPDDVHDLKYQCLEEIAGIEEQMVRISFNRQATADYNMNVKALIALRDTVRRYKRGERDKTA